MQEYRDSLSLYENRLQSESISVISIPSELGSDARGLAATPQHLLDHGLEGRLASLGLEASRVSIACPEPQGIILQSRVKNLDEVVGVSEASCRAVQDAVSRGQFALTLGGDHSIALGTISGAALAHESLGIIWVDAHPDANTEETTLSGNIHGMPMAALMGFGNSQLIQIGSTKRKIDPNHVLYVGLKDLDQAEIDFVRREKIEAVTMHDIAAHALQPVFAAIDALRGKVEKIWVSMDIDSIDEHYSPGVAMNSQGGLTRREVLAIANYIGKTVTLAGMDLVEMVPEKDQDGATTKLVFELISNFLGCSDGSYAEYMGKYEQAGNMDKILIPSARMRA